MTTRTDLIRKQRSGGGFVSRPLKIVVTGPFSAGKTTMIETISEVAIVGTDREITDETRSVKTRTTVAMDFGRITFAEQLSLFLFGTPGQRRFEVMWEILSDGMLGFILLVNAGDPRSVEEGSHILETFKRYADVPFIVGVTHTDELEGTPEEAVQATRERLGLPDEVDVVACDARDREHVKGLLLNVLMGVLSRLEAADSAGD
jgi:signal recognition particle receptor subunit beta